MFEKQKRIQIHLPFTSGERTLNWLCFAAVVFALVVTIINYNQMPDIIPTHFGVTGVPDGWGPKSTIFIIPVILPALIGLFLVFQVYPHCANVPVVLSEQNAEYQYRLVRKMLGSLQLLLVTMIAAFHWCHIQLIFDRLDSIPGALLLVIILGPFVILAAYLRAAYRGKRQQT